MLTPNKLHSFLKNRRGATAVEFALLALPFFALIVGALQLGIIFLANQTLDEAVDVASRTIQTGQVQFNGSNINTFKQDICDRVVLISDCTNNIRVSVQSLVDLEASSGTALYGANRKPIITDGTFRPGLGGELVVVSVSAFIRVLFLPFSLGSGGIDTGGNNGVFVSTSVAFKNELFSGNPSNQDTSS